MWVAGRSPVEEGRDGKAGHGMCERCLASVERRETSTVFGARKGDEQIVDVAPEVQCAPLPQGVRVGGCRRGEDPLRRYP